MRAADVLGAAELAAAAFSREITDEQARDANGANAYPLTPDPDRAFIAELDGPIVGMGEAIVPERLPTLSLLAVQPPTQIVGADARHEI